MKLCATFLSAHLITAAPNHVLGRHRRESGLTPSWDGELPPDGWEPDCAVRETGYNPVPGVCTQFYESVAMVNQQAHCATVVTALIGT